MINLCGDCQPDFGVICVWPLYPINTEMELVEKITGSKKMKGLGHAGVLLINGKSGLTKYYEYGRYYSKIGRVINKRTPNISIGSNKHPTKSSFEKCLKSLTTQAGKNTRLHGALFEKTDGFTDANKYAEKQKSFYNKQNLAKPEDVENPYNIWSNSCYHFAHNTLRAGGFRSILIQKFPVIDAWPAKEIGDDALFSDLSITYRPTSGEFIFNPDDYLE